MSRGRCFMKIHFRFDEHNPQHGKGTIFVSGKNCGQLCMSPDELDWFYLALERGCHAVSSAGMRPLEFVGSGDIPIPSQRKLADAEWMAHEVRDCRGLFDLKEGQSLLHAIETLKAQAEQPRRWIPLSERKPTEADADENGCLVWGGISGGKWFSAWHNNPQYKTGAEKITHWLPLPKLTPPANPDEVAFECIFQNWWQSHPFDPELDEDEVRKAFDYGVQAALAHARSKE